MKEKEKLIGICGVRIFDQNTLHFLNTLQKESEKQGYRLVSFSGNTDDMDESDEVVGEYQLFELLKYIDLCALIVLTEMIKNKKTIQKIVDIGEAKGIPIFSVDSPWDGCYSLVMDNVTGFEQIVRHVVEEHGCRRVNMIAGFKENRFSQERVEVYKRVLEKNQIPFEEERLGYGDFWDRPTREVVKRFLTSDLPFPEAIICANDSMALTTISVLNEHGLEVPEDVIVAGYDGTKDGEYFFPSLTSSVPQYEETVKWILKEIEKVSEQKKMEPCDVPIKVGIQKHQSCGCEDKHLRNNNRAISQLLDAAADSSWHTISMHQLLNDTLGMKNVMDIAEILPKHVHLWGTHYRYACVKSELLHSCEIPEDYNEVTNLLEVNQCRYQLTGVTWNIKELHKYIQHALDEENVKTVVIRLLNSGKEVYGFTVEGFEKMIDWKIQRCNEFAMFLSHAVHMVIHNFKMNELNQEIEEMSLQDVLTGINNRRGFFQRMGQIISKKENAGKYLYVFFVDMDGLKYINDTFGHAEGDFAITTLAKALTRMRRNDAVCARVGGDEFICAYMTESNAPYSAELFSEKMEGHIRELEGVADKSYPISASVGMIVEKIRENMDLDAVINQADDLMYEQKAAKKKKRI